MEENNVIEQCAICFEDLTNNTFTLECKHKFHTECIVKWFRNDNSSCPLCKDINTYDNLSYWTKIETITQIKHLGRRKNCPIQIKNILNKIKKQKEKEKNYKKYHREFNTKYKEILKEFSLLRRTKYKFARNIRKLERQLISFINICPIYIKK